MNTPLSGGQTDCEKNMDKNKKSFGLYQPAFYRITVSSHLQTETSMWFEGMTIVNEYDRDGHPFTIISGEIIDQAMLFGLLTKIRNLGLPLLAVKQVAAHELS